MRAWQVQARGEPIDVLHSVDLDPPEPGPGQVRIRVTAAGIGLPDVFMCRGTYPLTPPLPFIPGQEATGRGHRGRRRRRIAGRRSGHGRDRISGRVRLVRRGVPGPAASVFPVPDGLADAEAAGFWIPHLTGWIGLVDRGRIAGGDWLAVLGAAGGAGSPPCSSAARSAPRVIAVVSDEERAAFCRSLGAEATINHRDGPLAPALRELTGGDGVDLIYDPVGGSLAEDAAGALARVRPAARGRIRQRSVAEAAATQHFV